MLSQVWGQIAEKQAQKPEKQSYGRRQALAHGRLGLIMSLFLDYLSFRRFIYSSSTPNY
jgi:hypothetical protein